MEEDIMALPPKYYQKPNSLPRFLFSLVTLFIMLGALPIGVYLVGQRTSVLPQAANEFVERQGAVSFTLEKDQPVGRQDDQFATSAPGQVTVNLLAHSDGQEANLFVNRISFPSEYLELVKVATSSGEIQSAAQQTLPLKWIESRVDNQAGQIDLIAGVANPGVKTQIDQNYILAKLIFKVKSSGAATFHLDPDSTIFSSLTNQPLDVRKNDLTFDLPQVNLPGPSPTQAARFVRFVAPDYGLTLTSPTGGETIGFNTTSQITWVADNLEQIMVRLWVNGKELGQIAAVPAGIGRLDWKPSDFILPTFLTPANTYQIELRGVTATGVIVSSISNGPFAIVRQDINIEASQSANLAKRGGDANNDGSVDLVDLSILLSSFGKKENLDLGVDLNGDGVVNEVDLWLFKITLLR